MVTCLCPGHADFSWTASATWPLPVQAGSGPMATPDPATNGLRTAPRANHRATPSAGPHYMAAPGADIASGWHGTAAPAEQRTSGLCWEGAWPRWEGVPAARQAGTRQPTHYPSEGRNLSCAACQTDLATRRQPSPALWATQGQPSLAQPCLTWLHWARSGSYLLKSQKPRKLSLASFVLKCAFPQRYIQFF